VNPRIERLQREGAANPDVVSLGGGLPSEKLFPRRRLVAAFLRAVSERQASALQYGWPEGRDRLRAWIADRLCRRGALVSADDVIVTSGAQQAIALAARLQLRRGQRIGLDAESYPAAIDLFRTRGAVPIVGGARAAARYVMPEVGNPHGRGLDEDARCALLDSNLPLFEDDAYAELRFDGPPGRPLCADARTQVWHVGTFSKILAPGLRVGWLVPPPRYLQRALRHKRDLDLQANSLAQAVLEDFLLREDFDAWTERLRRFYRRRAERLAEAMAKRLPAWRFQPPHGGFSLWVETGEDADDTQLLATAIRHGVSFDPGRLFRPTGATRPLALRLCFCGEPGPRLEEGVKRLARAWDAFRRETDSLSANASGRARIGSRRVSPGVRPLRPRRRAGGAAVDALVAPVGVQAPDAGGRARIQARPRRVR
jgi:2-aminoadipate transaminase